MQTPPLHAVCVGRHWCPQLPQLFRSVCRLTQPRVHAVKPVLQVDPQVPALQTAVAFEGAVQTVPQAPQLFTELLRFVSQPLPALLSQLPKPALQVIPHTPPLQEAVPLVLLQTVPQAPQLFTELLRFVSQPLPALLSQLPKPALQVIPHTPLLHEAVPLVPLQTVPQAPQLFTSVNVLAHWLPHFESGVVQMNVHAPLEHSGVPFEGAGQTVPQVPQSSGFVCVSTHAVPQRTLGEGQVDIHTPPEQVCVGPHAVAQLPQLFGSVSRLVQTPAAAQKVSAVAHS